MPVTASHDATEPSLQDLIREQIVGPEPDVETLRLAGEGQVADESQVAGIDVPWQPPAEALWSDGGVADGAGE